MGKHNQLILVRIFFHLELGLDGVDILLDFSVGVRHLATKPSE